MVKFHIAHLILGQTNILQQAVHTINKYSRLFNNYQGVVKNHLRELIKQA
jgi:hypothetical protein